MATDNERLYVGTIMFIQAFDLQTGEVLWQGAQQESGKRGGLDVYTVADQVMVSDRIAGRLYEIDPQTGETVTVAEHPSIVFQQDGVTFASECQLEYYVVATHQSSKTAL